MAVQKDRRLTMPRKWYICYAHNHIKIFQSDHKPRPSDPIPQAMKAGFCEGPFNDREAAVGRARNMGHRDAT